jgi:hypothetical protein
MFHEQQVLTLAFAQFRSGNGGGIAKLGANVRQISANDVANGLTSHGFGMLQRLRHKVDAVGLVLAGPTSHEVVKRAYNHGYNPEWPTGAEYVLQENHFEFDGMFGKVAQKFVLVQVFTINGLNTIHKSGVNGRNSQWRLERFASECK